MGFQSVGSMLEAAGSETLLDQLDPKAYVETVADQLTDLAAEFPGVTLRISNANVSQFCEDLQRGMIQRTVAQAVLNGADEAVARLTIGPEDFDLPRRIETYAIIYKSVEMKFDAATARLLADDLKAGIVLRPSLDTKENTNADTK